MHKIVEKIIPHLEKSYRNNTEIISPSGRTRITTFRGNLIQDSYIYNSFPDDVKEEILDIGVKTQEKIKEEILERIQTNEKYKLARENDSLTDRQKILDEDYLLCRESSTNEFILFDKVERCIPDWLCSEAYLDMLPGKISGHKIKFAPLSRLVFDAYDPRPTIKSQRNGIPVMRLNAYTPPAWQIQHPDAPGNLDVSEPPELFTRFLSNLVPFEEEQTIVIDWMANALIKRNQSYLCLRGPRGNGKTLFMKMVMAVVGHHYFTKDGITKDGFNADLKGKRIVGIDDDTFIGSYQGYRLRKQLTNTSVTYNAKFKQTTKSERQYASYIIASNDEDQFYVTHEERKIINVTLTEENAIEFLTEKERDFIDELTKDFSEDITSKDTRFLAHLGHFLLQYARGNEGMLSPNAQYGGGTFWEDVVKSLSLMTRIAVDKALSGEYERVSYDELLIEFDESKSAGGREVRKRFPALAKELLRFRYGTKYQKVFSDADEKNLEFIVDPQWVKDLDI